MMSKDSPIAVFDSGVGSYSIMRMLQKELSDEHYLYLADRKSFPYGSKTHQELGEIILCTVRWLEEKYQPKLIIVASNTQSIQVLSEVQSKVKSKMIGVYPPIEKAATITKTRHIAILATKGAVQSSEIDNFIASKNLPKDIVIHKVDASNLVGLVEPGTFQTDPQTTELVIRSVVDPLLSKDKMIDTMTLSSTHLPFLLTYLQKLYPNVFFLDHAEIVAKQTKDYLTEKNILSSKDGKIMILTTVDKAGKLKPKGLKMIFKNLGLDTEIHVVNIV